MSRRRSTDPMIPVSISMPRSLFTRLNELLSWRSSRSKWVCSAIQAKIDAHEDESQIIQSISNKRLLTICFNRGIFGYPTYLSLTEELPTEETAEEQ